MRLSPNPTTALPGISYAFLTLYLNSSKPPWSSSLTAHRRLRKNHFGYSSTMKPSGVACDALCGCPVPCPGGAACSCATGEQSEDDPNIEHKKCPCGEHCGCSPCTCPKNEGVTGTGKEHCKCGDGCTCVTCRA